MPIDTMRTTRRAVLLPVLVLLVVAPACILPDFPDLEDSAGQPGTIRIRVTGGRGEHGILNFEDCKRLGRPDEILKDITVRDENGTEVAHVTVGGRDATLKVGNGRRCRIRAEKTVDVQTGASYEITAGDETVTLHWPTDEERDYYLNEADVGLFVRVPPGHRERENVLTLAEQGYRPISFIARMWNIPTDRAKQIVKRDDFPLPKKFRIGGGQPKRLWLLEDLEAWWFRDGRHAPR